jgi:hypothetical protein
MLAIPKPATPPTSCRRDIVIRVLPGNSVLLFLSAAVAGRVSARGEYRPEAVNDQVISI